MGEQMTDSADLGARVAEAAFRQFYATHRSEVLAYALRRADDPQDAADVVAETFIVAWRRWKEVPRGAATRAWLLGVARRALANQRRGRRRRERLAGRLGEELRGDASFERDDDSGVLEALGRLSVADQEILMLVCWEGLSATEAARAVGISALAARSRVHRAKRRLKTELDVQRAPMKPGSSNPQEG
jgi:RNA polymerase sigma-70 factor (ECF subfamily)